MMCETGAEPLVNHDACNSHSSKQCTPQSKVEKLLAKLPMLAEEYELERKVGEGTFSSVYLGRSKLDPKLRVAIKHLIPTCHPARIARELKCMHHLGGEDNIVEVISCFRMHDCVVFVMPYQPHDKFSSYMGELKGRELQVYLRGLLIALKRVHSYGIIHRDVKPSNFLFHRKSQRILLVDFGLAQNVEECSSENGEGLNSIKLELVNCASIKQEGKKKRKRDSSEALDIVQTVKRPALQPISNNVATPTREGLMNVKYSLLMKNNKSSSSKLTNITESKTCSTLSKNRTIQPKDGSSLIKSTLQQALVIKRQPFNQSFSNISTVQNNRFLRIQNSQVKLVGGVFAKPMPVCAGTSTLTSTSSPLTSSSQTKRCHCDGRPRVCNMCITRRARAAPRAGTPGFRPPEVLLKHPYQTTAVDIWAVGVIMLSIMSSTYPFFRAPDDITALAEIITIFGSDEIKALAKKLGRNIVCSEKRGRLDLRKLCEALRKRRNGEENAGPLLTSDCPLCKMVSGEECLCPSSEQRYLDSRFPDEAYQLLSRLLEIDPEIRITSEEALQHPFFSLQL